MLKSLVIASLAAAAVAAAGYAGQSNSHLTIPAEKTSPVDGKQMYISYCAPCHGTDGRGHGPVAPELKRQPIDLTVLSKNHGGQFPANHVKSVLEYGSEIPAHGNSMMPIWGPVFGRMGQGLPDQRLLRISNLSHYLETIQTK
jgi:mono/diheme cytochrome c family protein